MTPSNLSTIFSDINSWHERNYPTETLSQATLAIGEELGELYRAELKQANNIRGTREEWQIEKFKEAGDVLIAVSLYAFRIGTIQEVVKCLTGPEPKVENTKRHPTSEWALRQIWKYVNDLMECYEFVDAGGANKVATYDIIWAVRVYCGLNGFDAIDVLLQRWETISKRDFIVNPLTGGRENEK